MKKYWVFCVLLPLLLFSYGLYAEVVLSDEQAMELEATLDELEKISTEQQTTINNLKKQNRELETQLNELKQQSENKEKILDEQKETLNEAKSSSKRQGISSVLRSILISIGVGILGLVAGILFF